MADRSHVTSFEAIEAFRADLIIFLSKARPTVEEVSNELQRMRVWLESEQRDYWNKELRLLGRQLEDAQQELFAARVSKLQNTTALQEMTVQRLRRKIRDAEEKQEITKKWSRSMEDRTSPMAKEVDSLHSFLSTDMRRAVAYLDKVLETLEAYADVAAPDASPSPKETPGATLETTADAAPKKEAT
ncbi:MAG TPA: hypothetical protein VFD66_06905 [Verrucomicrobiae bacterium]|nr:hypothetical protein [Verrucomicrobiae bacterium]